MRTFEVVVWLVAVVWAARVAWAPLSRKGQLIMLATAMVTTALHAGIEGVRFHMLPTYALLGVMVFAVARGRSPQRLAKRGRATRTAVLGGVVVWATIGALLPSIFPVFTFDEPGGRYGIGTAVYELKHGPNDRDLVVQAWYPAIARGVPAGVTTHVAPLEAAYAAFTGLPALLFDSLRLVRTHAGVNVPVASDRETFPVVLFSHGPLGANRSQSIFQMEALASAGFIAIAIDHTGYASTTIFPDGHAILPGDEAAWPVFVDDRSTAMLNTWVADVRFVLDQLARLNDDDPARLLTGHLDLSRVGYLGASFGGSVVVQALLDEPRILAGVAEDGKPYFDKRTLSDLRRPLMYMQSAAPYIPSTDAQLARWGLTNATFRTAEQDHYVRQMQLLGQAVSPIYNVYIRRTNHLTFSDLGLMLRLPDSSLMDVRRAHQIINRYTVAFFERYLNDRVTPLVDGQTPSPYGEVTVASRNVGSAEPRPRSVD